MNINKNHNPRILLPGLGTVLVLLATQASAFPQPAQIELTGVVRDFKAYNEPGGHPGMERGNRPAGLGPRWVTGNLVEPIIGADRKPVFTNNGILVKSPWKDGSGRTIAMQLATLDPQPTDNPGTLTNPFNEYLDPASFRSLFNDELGVNLSASLTLTFNLQADGTYLFDADTDPTMTGGFFPINGQLYGNYSGNGGNRNYHFSFELHGQFLYSGVANQVFEFSGDDDVWVFINDRLVVDLGGRHSEKTHFVDLDRLNLTPGEMYTLDFFLVERQTSGSHCKITTNLLLEMPTDDPTVAISAPFD